MHTSTVETRRFESPDDALDFADHGRIDIVKLSGGSIGMRAVFQPGWRWDVDEKPLLGNPDSCPMRHVGYCVRGSIVVRMIDSGRQQRLRPGDFFEIPPGHDAHVDGDEACELILFAPPEAH